MEDANELCKCDEYSNIIQNFVSYSFNTMNPYDKPMKRMDGTPCDCDEFSYSRLFRKKYVLGDKNCFDTETVKCK